MTKHPPEATRAAGPDEPVIGVSDLRMRYGAREALTGLSFEVFRGELFALLGPNGAGKTSTVEILEGYRRRTGGQVSVLGADPWQADLTVAECLRLYAGYYPDPWPAGDLLELTGLSSQSGQRAAQLSGGQRRKLDLALALTGRPEVLFLDEPTTGFDPAARRNAWDTIAALKDTGTTIILTTHYMEEAERLADRVAVIAAGALVSQGPRDRLIALQAAPTITFTLPAGLTKTDLPELVRDAASSMRDGTVTLAARAPLAMLRLLADWAERGGHDLPDLEVRRPSLEDAYLQLTGAKGSGGHAMTQSAALVGHQLRYDLMAFFRNGQARFFTLALPVAFLLIFATVFSDKTVPLPGGVIHTSVYYVPSIIALGIIQAAVSNLAISVTAQRENGILKRRRATPVSAGVLITARALTAVTVSLAMIAVLAAIGWFAYSAHIPPATRPRWTPQSR